MTTTTAVAAREACRHNNGRFGEQALTDPGIHTLDSYGHPTVIDLLHRDLLPTLNEAGDNFDTEALGMWLRENNLILVDGDGRVGLPGDLAANPAFQAKVAQLVEDAAAADNDQWADDCPVCGDPADYCQGHGEIGDPAGYAILVAHDDGDHSMCVAGCHAEVRA